MTDERFLVDTNIISELVRPRPNAGVFAWARRVHRVAVRGVSVEEVAFGLAKRPHPQPRRWFDSSTKPDEPTRRRPMLLATPAARA